MPIYRLIVEMADEVEAEATAAEKAGEPSAEIGELRSQLQRLQAEFENYRKRSEQSSARSREAGKMELACDVLSFTDDFEAAMAHLCRNDREGMNAIQAKFSKVLAANSIRKMDCLGRQADPLLHEVVRAEEDGAREGTILKVVKDGFLYGDAVLRHAFVVVSKGSAAPKEKNAGGKSDAENVGEGTGVNEVAGATKSKTEKEASAKTRN